MARRQPPPQTPAQSSAAPVPAPSNQVEICTSPAIRVAMPVVAMACNDEVIPLQERIESVSDDSDLEEVYNTERHLLYVACTRARDNLLVTAVHGIRILRRSRRIAVVLLFRNIGSANLPGGFCWASMLFTCAVVVKLC
jgi:hypothetical protein